MRERPTRNLNQPGYEPLGDHPTRGLRAAEAAPAPAPSALSRRMAVLFGMVALLYIGFLIVQQIAPADQAATTPATPADLLEQARLALQAAPDADAVDTLIADRGALTMSFHVPASVPADAAPTYLRNQLRFYLQALLAAQVSFDRVSVTAYAAPPAPGGARPPAFAQATYSRATLDQVRWATFDSASIFTLADQNLAVPTLPGDAATPHPPTP